MPLSVSSPEAMVVSRAAGTTDLGTILLRIATWAKSCLLQRAVRPVTCFGEPEIQDLFHKDLKVAAQGINTSSDVWKQQ